MCSDERNIRGTECVQYKYDSPRLAPCVYLLVAQLTLSYYTLHRVEEGSYLLSRLQLISAPIASSNRAGRPVYSMGTRLDVMELFRGAGDSTARSDGPSGSGGGGSNGGGPPCKPALVEDGYASAGR